MLKRNKMINPEATEPSWLTHNALGHKCQGTEQYTITSPVSLTGLPGQKGEHSCKSTAWEAEKGLFIPFPRGEAKHLCLYRNSHFPKVPLMLWENCMHKHVPFSSPLFLL